jgi:hypothetical protein
MDTDAPVQQLAVRNGSPRTERAPEPAAWCALAVSEHRELHRDQRAASIQRPRTTTPPPPDRRRRGRGTGRRTARRPTCRRGRWCLRRHVDGERRRPQHRRDVRLARHPAGATDHTGATRITFASAGTGRSPTGRPPSCPTGATHPARHRRLHLVRQRGEHRDARQQAPPHGAAARTRRDRRPQARVRAALSRRSSRTPPDVARQPDPGRLRRGQDLPHDDKGQHYRGVLPRRQRALADPRSDRHVDRHRPARNTSEFAQRAAVLALSAPRSTAGRRRSRSRCPTGRRS